VRGRKGIGLGREGYGGGALSRITPKKRVEGTKGRRADFERGHYSPVEELCGRRRKGSRKKNEGSHPLSRERKLETNKGIAKVRVF